MRIEVSPDGKYVNLTVETKAVRIAVSPDGKYVKLTVETKGGMALTQTVTMEEWSDAIAKARQPFIVSANASEDKKGE